MDNACRNHALFLLIMSSCPELKSLAGKFMPLCYRGTTTKLRLGGDVCAPKLTRCK